MSSKTASNDLLHGAHAEGVLSSTSYTALSIPDIGAAIQTAIGSPIEVDAAEAVNVVMLIDDSGSISYSDNEKVVCDGHNIVLDALLRSKSKDGVFITTMFLNGNVINSFVPLESAERLSSGNYAANGGTPLYDMMGVTLGATVAKSQELAESGVPCRNIVLVVTDGEEMHSRRLDRKDVAALVRDCLMQETFIIAGMGIDNGSYDFRKEFKSLGIEDRWILTPGNSDKEIRAAFNLFSQSAVQASQGAVSFSKAALGGFA